MTRENIHCRHNVAYLPISNPQPCKAGVDRRELVGGPLQGWIKRTPCCTRNETDVVCEHFELLDQAQKAEPKWWWQLSMPCLRWNH